MKFSFANLHVGVAAINMLCCYATAKTVRREIFRVTPQSDADIARQSPLETSEAWEYSGRNDDESVISERELARFLFGDANDLSMPVFSMSMSMPMPTMMYCPEEEDEDDEDQDQDDEEEVDSARASDNSAGLEVGHFAIPTSTGEGRDGEEDGDSTQPASNQNKRTRSSGGAKPADDITTRQQDDDGPTGASTATAEEKGDAGPSNLSPSGSTAMLDSDVTHVTSFRNSTTTASSQTSDPSDDGTADDARRIGLLIASVGLVVVAVVAATARNPNAVNSALSTARLARDIVDRNRSNCRGGDSYSGNIPHPIASCAFHPGGNENV